MYGNPRQRLDRFGWSDFAWNATARVRYCLSYCQLTNEHMVYDGLGNVTVAQSFHKPSCAYATDRWLQQAIEMLLRVNRGW